MTYSYSAFSTNCLIHFCSIVTFDVYLYHFFIFPFQELFLESSSSLFYCSARSSFILTSVVSLLWHTCVASLFLPRVPLLWEEATWAKYWMTFFVFSVFPAPDSPLEHTKTHTHTGNKVRNTHTYNKYYSLYRTVHLQHIWFHFSMVYISILKERTHKNKWPKHTFITPVNIEPMQCI